MMRLPRTLLGASRVRYASSAPEASTSSAVPPVSPPSPSQPRSTRDPASSPPSLASSPSPSPAPPASADAAAAELSPVFGRHVPLAPTHGVHVATLHLRAYTDSVADLQFFTSFALRAAKALGLPTSGAVALPTRTSLFTVPRSPFAHKKSQQNFWRKEHKRAIKVWDGNEEIVTAWLAYLRKEALGGVGMKAQTFTYRRVGWGQQLGLGEGLAATGGPGAGAGVIEGGDDAAQVEQLARELQDELAGEIELAAADAAGSSADSEACQFAMDPPGSNATAASHGGPTNGPASASAAAAGHESAAGAKGTNAAPPARRSYPGLTSAEQSLFPNSMPVRQTLPSIHAFPNSAQPPSQSPQPPSLNYSRQSQPPPHSHSHSHSHSDTNRYNASASPYGAASLPPLSTAAKSPAATTPTPPIIPPAASPKLTAQSASSATPAAPPHSSGSPPLARPNLPGIHQISPRLSAASQPPPPPPPANRDATNSPFGGSGAGTARRNPMSVSSMLSGPPRASGIAAFTPSSAGPPQPPVLPPMSSSVDPASSKPTATGRSGSPPEPPHPGGAGGGGQARSPILSRPTASGASLPSIRPPSHHELKPPSPALEKKETTPATSAATSQPSKPAYPSLPSAFARESPYSTAPSTPATASTLPQGQSQAHSQPQSQADKPGPAQPFFPNLAGYRPPPFPANPSSTPSSRQPPYASPAASSTPASSSSGNVPHQPQQQQPKPTFPWQQGFGAGPSQSQTPPKVEHSHPHPHSHAHAHSHPHSHSHPHPHGHGHAQHPHSLPHAPHSSHAPASTANPASTAGTTPSAPSTHQHSHSHSHPGHSHPAARHPHSHPQHGQPGHGGGHAHNPHATTSGGGGHARRPSAAGSIAHASSPQANRTPGAGSSSLAAVKPSPAGAANGNGNGTSSKAAPGGGANPSGGIAGAAGARFSSLMDGAYGQSIRENGPGIINKSVVATPPPPSAPPTTATNGQHAQQHNHHHHHHHHGSQQPPQKRRRSETTAQTSTVASPAPPVGAPPAAQPHPQPSATPAPPAPPPPPPFTHTDARLATIRPPLVSVDNSAIDAYLATTNAAAPAADADAPFRPRARPFAGRRVYDPFVDPADLLDGATLRACVGGTVQVVVPTSLLVSPPLDSAATTATTVPVVRSSCSVPPVSPPPIALAFGPPGRYDGRALDRTSDATPLAVPAHVFDLNGVARRKVWGTDVYTDDSDVVAVLLHSGWVRLATRERRLRAGEPGAGLDAIRRARERVPAMTTPTTTGGASRDPDRKKQKEKEKEGEAKNPTVSEVVNDVAQLEPNSNDDNGDDDGKEGGARERDPPKHLLVTLGILPALIRYQGLERGGIRSRSWGNGHDGVSLRVENIEPFNGSPVDHGRRVLRRAASVTSRQIALDRKVASNPFPHSFLPPRSAVVEGDDRVVDEPLYAPMSKPKRFRFSTDGDGDGLEGRGPGVVDVADTFVLDFWTGRGPRFVGIDDVGGDGRIAGGDRMEVEV
ncbi:hypothetical protein JCM11491_002710 [Sporobolomyces phaffii]